MRNMEREKIWAMRECLLWKVHKSEGMHFILDCIHNLLDNKYSRCNNKRKVHKSEGIHFILDGVHNLFLNNKDSRCNSIWMFRFHHSSKMFYLHI